MNNPTRRQVVVTVVVALILVSLAASGLGLGLAAPNPEDVEFMAGHLVELRAEGRDVFHHVPPPKEFSQWSIQSATITVDFLENETDHNGYYCDPWDSAAQAAFQYAVDIWETLITSGVTIEVKACWTGDLGASTLGSAGPRWAYRNFPGAPLADTWYPVALANALYGSDLSADPDIDARFNMNFAWYFGTDGNTPIGQYDFVTAVLHELGHGLGFLGSMSVGPPSCSVGSGCWGGEGWPKSPYIYDRFTENGSGQSLIDTNLFPNNSPALASQLQSDNVFFDGTNANAANGGQPVKLYAPSTWLQGSSYSHLDDDTFDGTENALMTPSIGSAESNHQPGPVAFGIFEDMGWVTSQPAPDLSIVKRVVGTTNPGPGDPITFTLSIENLGTATASGVIVTDTLPASILMPSWATTLSGVSVRSGTYVWDLPDLSASASGVISVYGTVDPTLPSVFSIWNTATISTGDEETNDSNNSSTALIGGTHVYLPVVLRNSQ